MNWKLAWYSITGNVEVTVRAKDNNEQSKEFAFVCYISEKVDDYDRLDYLSDIAYWMAKLKRYHSAEITDIQNCFPRNLLTE